VHSETGEPICRLPVEGKIEYYVNGSLAYIWANPCGDDGSLAAAFLEDVFAGRNNGVISFQTYWVELASGDLIQSGQTIGSTAGKVVAVSSASTPRTPTLVAPPSASYELPPTQCVLEKIDRDGTAKCAQNGRQGGHCAIAHLEKHHGKESTTR